MAADGPSLRPVPAAVQEKREAFALPSIGPGVGQAAVLLIRAQMLARAGQSDASLQVLDQALAWVEQTGVRVTEADVWRMRGELLLSPTPAQQMGPGSALDGNRRTEEGEASLKRALEIAQAQGARWFELRASVRLARLWQTQGRTDDARQLVHGIYDWFTEGFETVDLVEAKTLLAELG